MLFRFDTSTFSVGNMRPTIIGILWKLPAAAATLLNEQALCTCYCINAALSNTASIHFLRLQFSFVGPPHALPRLSLFLNLFVSILWTFVLEV